MATPLTILSDEEAQFQASVRRFAKERVGMVTAPYVGRAAGGVWSRMEALGISTDFMAGC